MNKKIILSTLAFGLFTFAAGANAGCHDEASLKIGGKVDSKFVSVSTKSSSSDVDYKYVTDSNGNYKPFSGTSFLDTDVAATLEAKKTVNDLTFGANAKLASTTINSGTTSTAAFKYANVFLEATNSGKLILGGTPTAIDELFLDVPQTATGGAFGDFPGYTNGNVGYYDNAESLNTTGQARYLTTLDMPSTLMETKAAKMVYISPNMSGFQIGMSYTFDSQANGGFADSSSKYANSSSYTWGYAKKIISIAGKYEVQMSDDSLLTVTLGAEHGKSKDVLDASTTSLDKHEDIQAYTAGVTLAVGPFKVGGKYVSHGKSLAPSVDYYNNLGTFTSTVTDSEVALFNKKGNAIGLGASYEQEGMVVALNTLHTQYQFNKFKSVSLQTQYSVNSGLVPYVEATIYKYTPGQYTYTSTAATTAAASNKGSVLFVGTVVNF